MFEIASPSTARNDLVAKRRLYASLGITEYWRFDSTGGDFYGAPLVGERLVVGECRPLQMPNEADGTVWAYSATPRLGPSLGRWPTPVLRPSSPRSLLNQTEEQAVRQAAEARAMALEAELRWLQGESL